LLIFNFFFDKIQKQTFYLSNVIRDYKLFNTLKIKVYSVKTKLIWYAVMWVLWQARNEMIFRGIVVVAEEIFDRTQVVSWKLLLSKKATSPCLFYEWCIDSFDCIVRSFWAEFIDSPIKRDVFDCG
jgi:hypothetical protein